VLQNGVDNVERLGAILPPDRVAGGAAYIATVIAAPGVIKHSSHFAKMRYGRADKKPDAVLQAFTDAGKAAKFDIDVSPDINVEIWEKFIFLTAMSGSTASLRSAVGAIRSDPELRSFYRALMQEAYDVGRARGVGLAPDFVESRMKFLDTVEPGMKASMAHDLERGNRIELDWLAGKVRALGREYNIPTPASDTVYTVLKLYRMGSRP
jgi:2-dehydropantoate 2-reductase